MRRADFFKPLQMGAIWAWKKGRAWLTLAGPSFLQWPVFLMNVWSVSVALVDYCTQITKLCKPCCSTHSLQLSSPAKWKTELGKRSCRVISLSNNFSLFGSMTSRLKAAGRSKWSCGRGEGREGGGSSDQTWTSVIDICDWLTFYHSDWLLSLSRSLPPPLFIIL